jgi:phage terminase large subunit
MMTEYEKEDPYSVGGVLDTAAWNRTGYTGPTIGETIVRAGHKVRPADKNRIAGKIQIHERLKIAASGRPKMVIFNTCPNLIRELQSLPSDKSKPEDVDTKAQDHAYDALRYMVMSRPRSQSPFEQMFQFKQSLSYEAVDDEFGY